MLPRGPARFPPAFRPHPFDYHAEVLLTIDSISHRGDGVGRVKMADNQQPWVVMVPYVLPGEVVRVRIVRNERRHSQGEVVRIEKPSPLRLQPACPLFGLCGGCQYQMAPYDQQLEWKTEHVRAALQRIGGLQAVAVSSTLGSPRQYHYRSKLTPHYQAAQDGTDVAIGFAAASAASLLVDAPYCHLASEAINDALPAMREAVRQRVLNAADADDRSGQLLLRHTSPDGVMTDPEARVTERLGALQLTFAAGDFFQNNLHILPSLVAYVIGQARGDSAAGTAAVPTAAVATAVGTAAGAEERLVEGAEDRLAESLNGEVSGEASGEASVDYLIDAYCGSGLFALSAAVEAPRQFASVVGVEVCESAVASARRNAEVNGVSNVRFLAASAECIFDGIEFDGSRTAVLVDPPRRGCDDAFLAQLIRFAPRRIVYVSCAPDTQARDLKMLLEAGYALQCVQPFDLFPQSRHLEAVATLVWPDPAARPIPTARARPAVRGRAGKALGKARGETARGRSQRARGGRARVQGSKQGRNRR